MIAQDLFPSLNLTGLVTLGFGKLSKVDVACRVESFEVLGEIRRHIHLLSLGIRRGILFKNLLADLEGVVHVGEGVLVLRLKLLVFLPELLHEHTRRHEGRLR